MRIHYICTVITDGTISETKMKRVICKDNK